MKMAEKMFSLGENQLKVFIKTKISAMFEPLTCVLVDCITEIDT